MANAISNDNFSTHQVLERRNPDANPGRSREHSVENGTPPQGGEADISRAHQRLSQESGDVREPAIVSAREAGQKVALLKNLMSESPKAALTAQGNVKINAFEAAMARPAT